MPASDVENPPDYTDVKTPKRSALKHGIVRKGSDSFKYLLVPAGWVPADDSVDQVFKYLRLAPPTLVFRTMRCDYDFTPDRVGLRGDSSNWQVVYEDGENDRKNHAKGEVGGEEETAAAVTEEEKKRPVKGEVEGEEETAAAVTEEEKKRFKLVMKTRIQDFLTILSKTCGKYGAYYLLDCASLRNEFDDLVLQSLSHSGVAIVECDLWDPNHILGSSNYEDKEERIRENAEGVCRNIPDNVEERKKILRHLKEHGKSLDEDVEKELNWWPQTSRRIRHVIFFERREERDEFRRLLMRDVPVGLLASGGHADNIESMQKSGADDIEKLKEQLEYLRDGRPVISFRHAVGPAHCLVSLLDYIDEMNEIKKAAEIQKRIEKLVMEQVGAMEVRKSLNSVMYWYMRRKLRKARPLVVEVPHAAAEVPHAAAEVPHAAAGREQKKGGGRKLEPLRERCLLIKNNDLHLNSYEVFRDEMVVQVENFQANIPRGFNRNAVMVFDPLEDNPSNTMEDITSLMASIYSDVPEIGGAKTEKWVIMHTKYEITRLRCLEKREQKMSWILKMLIFFFSFFSTLLSCTIELARKELAKSESNNTKDPSPFIQGLEAAMPFLEGATIILPVLLAISLTIYTTFSPRMRESKILLARAQVERLLYLYRLGVGKFRARIDDGPIHRQNFVMELKKILESVRDNDLTKYSLVSNLASKVRVEEVLEVFDKPSGEQVENDEIYEKKLFGTKRRKPRDFKHRIQLAQAWDRIEGEDSNILLSDEDYIRKRIIKYLPELDREVSSLSKQKRLLECSIIVLSAVTAIMAHFGGQLWIPVVLAFVTMLEGLVEFRHIPKRIETANITIGRLEETLLWWRGLGLMERMPANKERLVNEVEDAIMDRIFVIADSIRASETKSDTEHNNGSVSTGPRANQNETTKGP